MSNNSKRIVIDLCSSAASEEEDDDKNGWNALMDVVLPPPPVPVPVPAAIATNEDLMDITPVNNVQPKPTRKRLRNGEEQNASVPAKRARSKSLLVPVPTNVSTAATLPKIVQRQATQEQVYILPLEERLNPDSLRAILSMLSGEEDISARGRLKQTCKFLNTFISTYQPDYEHAMITISNHHYRMELVPFDMPQHAWDSSDDSEDITVNEITAQDSVQGITDKEFLYFLFACSGGGSSTLDVDALLKETAITERMEPEEIGRRLSQRHEPIRQFLNVAEKRGFPCPQVKLTTPDDRYGRVSLLVKARPIPFGFIRVRDDNVSPFSPFALVRQNESMFQYHAFICKEVEESSMSMVFFSLKYRVTLNVGQYDALGHTLIFSLFSAEQNSLKTMLIDATLTKMNKLFFYDRLRSLLNGNERVGFFPTTTSMSTMLPPSFPLMASPPGLNFVLNDYQCEAISWMHHFEHLTKEVAYIAELPHLFGPLQRNGITISALELQKIADSKYTPQLHASYQLDLVERDQIESNSMAYHRFFTCKGGLLADATGLGKTVTVLGHIANNLPAEPTALKAHSLHRFQCRASLVIVPNSIAAQWHNEAQRFASGKMKILYLSKKLDCDKLTHKHVMQAGVIIITAEYLERNLSGGHRYFESRPLQRNHQMQQCENFLADPESFLNERATLLELFKYERIILDEAHILLDLKKYTSLWKALSILHGKSYWAVTATPPTTLDLLFPFLQFLRVVPRFSAITNATFEGIMKRTLVTDEKGPKTRMTGLDLSALGFTFEFQAMMRAFVRHCFWRNTQSNVAHFEDAHFKIPVARQRIFTVTLSREEDMFVKAFTFMETNLELFNQNSFLFGVVTPGLRFFGKHERNIYLTCSRLTMAKRSDDMEEAHTSSAPENDLWTPLVHNLYDLGNRIRYAMHTLPLTALQTRITSLEERRVVLVGRLRLYPRNPRVINEWIQLMDRKNRCIKLLEQMNAFENAGSEMATSLIAEARRRQASSLLAPLKEDTPFQRACAKYGTKAASVVQYLQTLYSTSKKEKVRVLLFSQYTETLENFQSLMKFLNVSASLVVGHVDRKSKAIRDFNNGTIQALLIPVDKNAAGLHLVAASHVILLDPIMDANGAATELQAIARAIRRGQTKPVDVVRFVVRDTREYEMIQRNLVVTGLYEEVAYSPTCV